MVVYIPIYHCIMKLEQIWTNKLLIGVHFHFATTLSQCCNCKKGLQRTRFNDSLFVKFCTCKKKTMKVKNSLKFSICFSNYEFILDGLKTFVNTLCYNNDENCDLFKLYNVLPLKV
jgi:hypothetical protein